MGKKLKDFVVECNLDGWHCKDKKTNTTNYLRNGQKFSGYEISERMVEALEGVVDTFVDRQTGNRLPVLSLMGGDANELRVAFEANEIEKNEKINKEIEKNKKELEKAKAKAEEMVKEEDKEEEKKKPVRKAK